MPLTKITITGADDDIELDNLLDFSWYNPFLEWGILFGKKEKEGTDRYPGREWIEALLQANDEGWDAVKLSAHLCFPWVGNLRQNYLSWNEIGLLNRFDRIQINLSYHDADPESVRNLFKCINNINKPVIFQNNGTLPIQSVLDYVPDAIMGSITEPHILFDCSGGKGIEIRNYPEPIKGISCGYAGGIGPDNIKRVLEELEQKFPSTDYWIDMESKVRTDNKLDLKKVERCLEIAKEFVNE